MILSLLCLCSYVLISFLIDSVCVWGGGGGVIGLKEAMNKQVSCSSNISVKGCLQNKMFLKEQRMSWPSLNRFDQFCQRYFKL